jgi:hypothetical protein
MDLWYWLKFISIAPLKILARRINVNVIIIVFLVSIKSLFHAGESNPCSQIS